MKNWEEMRGLTFVNIKSTKAKSISEGMTRCQIEKLSRNNPVYQHIRLHKKRSLPACPVCRSPKGKQQYPFSSRKKTSPCLSLKVKIQARSKTQEVEKIDQALTSQLGLFTARKHQYHDLSYRLDKIIEQTPRRPKTPKERVLQEGQRMKNAIDKFDKSMKRSKTHFSRLNKGIDKAESYFLTSINDIQLEINEDKGLSIREVKSDYEKIKEDMNLHFEKMKKLAKRVKQFKKPVIFPFTNEQVHNIVNSDSKVKNSKTVKLKRIMTNLYEYKSTKNYSNRMKMVNEIISRRS